MADSGKTPFWMTVLLMLGSYAFGFNLHNIIHEFGHAAAVWMQGGKMTGFYFHPFEACLNFSTYVPNHILLYAGGAFIGGASTIVFAFLAWKFRTPFMVPFVTACSAGLTTTSRWMLMAPFGRATTDYTSMVDLGFPVALIIVAGVVFLVVGVSVRILYLPLLGVTYETGIPRRIAIYELGLLPYSIVNVVYVWLTRGGRPLLNVAFLIVMAVLIAVEAVLSKWLPSRLPFFKKIGPVRIRPSHVSAVWLGAIILIAAMFLLSAKK
jgi:hypothetical protein